jgi:aryl-alcohol dehydrogenase-like predicted oxidoreductase
MEAGGTIEALRSLRAEGKVRYTGMSGTLPNLPDHIALGVFDVFQIRHEFILRFTLSHPGVSSAVVGTSSLKHVRANVAMASRGPLPGDVYAEAVRRLAAA